MPADKAIVAYRDWLEKFDDKGWRIDMDEFNRRNGIGEALTVPCPGRRTSGNWVLDEVPRIKNRAERKKIENAA